LQFIRKNARIQNQVMTFGTEFQLMKLSREVRKIGDLMNIYVGNLGYEVSDDQLQTAFQVYGTVESARIITDRDTDRSKGFGFVEMPDQKQALAATSALNGTELGGRTITVNEARPKAPHRDDRSGGYRSGGGGGRNRY
jgi:RNA recognition motif-containing protein